jgi:outer membrane protein assembly factor BamB
MYNPTHRFDTSVRTAPTTDISVTWSHEFQDPVGEVAVWDDSIYFTVGESIVVIGQDGSPSWRFSTGKRVHSSPAVVDGTVYVGSNDGHVYALDAATGRK